MDVKSYLGRIVLSRPNDGALFIPVKAYFDGSHTGESDWKGGSHIALAGFAVGDALLAAFEDGWQAVLGDDRYRPRAPYLHMKELRSDSAKSPFSKRNGWDNTKRKRLVSDLLDYLNSLDRERTHYFVCGVDAGAVRRRQQQMAFPSAIRICTHYAPHYVLKWYGEKFPGLISSMHIFFDRDEPFEDDFKALRRKQTSNRFEIAGNKEIWELVKSETALSSKTKEGSALQAADLLAWATVRQMNPTGSPFLADVAVKAKRMVSSSWTRWNDSNLDEVIDKVPTD